MRLRRLANPGKNYQNVKAWRAANPGARTEEARRYRQKHPDKVRATAQRYRENHPDLVRERGREAQRRIRAVNPEMVRARWLAWRERREQKLAFEAGRPRPGVCDLCRGNGGGIVFDHCHIEGNFRGWLCDRCNKVLGLIRDNPRLLRRMAQYLEKANGKVNHKPEKEPPDLGFCWPEKIVPS